MNWSQDLAHTKNRWKIWGIHFDLANKEQRVEELEREMEAPDFWDNAEVSQQKMKELKSMKDDMEIYHSLETQMEDMETMIEILAGAGENQGWLGYNRLFESNIRKTSK